MLEAVKNGPPVPRNDAPRPSAHGPISTMLAHCKRLCRSANGFAKGGCRKGMAFGESSKFEDLDMNSSEL